MRRILFTLICTVVMTLGTALPVAGTGLTLVTLKCTNGTNISAQVDADTLAGLVDAVQGMTLYPAGLSCTLLQTPLLAAMGGTAAAATKGGFIVGSGRFTIGCSETQSYWVNFAVTAETQTSEAGAVVAGGSVNFTIPSGQCRPTGYVASKPTCLAINADQPKPPAGAWYAYLLSEVTQSSGDLVSSFPVGSVFGSSWKDTGNPSKQTLPDRAAVGYGGSCPNVGSPDADGSFTVLKGNVTINVSR